MLRSKDQIKLVDIFKVTCTVPITNLKKKSCLTD